jgi:hypothetical protein
LFLEGLAGGRNVASSFQSPGRNRRTPCVIEAVVFGLTKSRLIKDGLPNVRGGVASGMKDQIVPMQELAHNLRIDPDRLWDAIMGTAAIGATLMVFVPRKDGISYNGVEFASKMRCAAGARVLLNAVLRFDRQSAARNG